VTNRLDVYEKQTAPLLAYYERRALLTGVRGEGGMDGIAEEIRRAVRAAGGA
jgi:adenylate kinase family enzyme